MGEALFFDDRVRERDLDHFLIEDLQADIALRRWLVAQLTHAFTEPDGSTARVGKSSRRTVDGRQTDVQVEYLSPTGEALAVILIENKVTDGFQDGQAESYAAEVAALRQRFGNRRAACILVAPISNLLSRGNTNFDATVPVERFAEYLRLRLQGDGLEPELRARLEVRAELLDMLCGKRPGSRWVPNTIAGKRDFATAYAEIAREAVPSLTVRPSTDGQQAVTRFFDGFAGQTTMPVKVRLKHEFGNEREPMKYVNLQFDGAGGHEDAFRNASGLLPTDGSIFVVRAGASLMVRIRTPAIVPDPEKLEAQRSAINEGLRGIQRLADWMEEHHQRVRAILAAGTT